jgi:hypothetical protein
VGCEVAAADAHAARVVELPAREFEKYPQFGLFERWRGVCEGLKLTSYNGYYVNSYGRPKKGPVPAESGPGLREETNDLVDATSYRWLPPLLPPPPPEERLAPPEGRLAPPPPLRGAL